MTNPVMAKARWAYAWAHGYVFEWIIGAYGIFEIPVQVTTLTGQLRGGGEEDVATMLYVGRSLNLPHYKRKFFKGEPTTSTKWTTLFTFGKHMRAVEDTADVVFIDIGWPYSGLINRKGDYLTMPDWLTMVAPLADTWDGTVQNFRKTMRKNIKRLIRKNEYRCEPTHDEAEIKAFYDDYYDAFINARYDDEVFMTPRIQVERRAREGVILKVVGPKGPVAAGVYFPYKEDFCLLASGMPAALVENPPEANISALYYFSMEYAFEHGFKTVNFLGTRGFPDDGLLQFKRKWGARLEDTFNINSVLFRPRDHRPMAARFCELFPLLSRKGKELEMVLCSTDPNASRQDYDKLVANSHCDGIASVRIVQLGDETAEAVQQLSQNPSVTVSPASLDGFAQVYVDGR